MRVIFGQDSVKNTKYPTDKLDMNNSARIRDTHLDSNYQLKCRLPEDGLYTEEGTVYSASFHVGSEKYLFETSAKISNSLITLTVLNLFHLQKRKNFRYTLPEGYPATLLITKLNQEECQYACRLLDLSTEGCAVLLEQEVHSLQLNDLLQAEIHLGARNAIVIQGALKNLRPTRGTDLVLGVEFNHLASTSEGAIIHAITDLQRELYFLKVG